MRYSTIDLCAGCVKVWSDHPQEGPATHLILLSIVFRSYEEKSDFAGPPQRMRYFWSTETQYYSLFANQEVPEYRLNCLFSVPFNSNSENPNSIARAHPYIERCMYSR
jgi:hypothetical protein